MGCIFQCSCCIYRAFDLIFPQSVSGSSHVGERFYSCGVDLFELLHKANHLCQVPADGIQFFFGESKPGEIGQFQYGVSVEFHVVDRLQK